MDNTILNSSRHLFDFNKMNYIDYAISVFDGKSPTWRFKDITVADENTD